LAIFRGNLALLKENNLTLKLFVNQFVHKVYHCNDTGILPNKFHDLF